MASTNTDGQGSGNQGGTPVVEPTNPPDLNAIINQAITALLPTLVTQVTTAIGGNNANQNDNETVPVNQDVPEVRRYRQGCTFKDFKNCGLPEFDGSSGAVGLLQWFEKMEAVISRSNCTHDQRINFVTGMLSGDALSWWNEEVELRGRDTALDMSWTDFKALFTAKYCPPHELQKLQLEFTQQQMNGSDYMG